MVPLEDDSRGCTILSSICTSHPPFALLKNRPLWLHVPSLFDKRLLIFSGKGGAGKSTVSAAVAVAAARRGKRVLIFEIGGMATPAADCVDERANRSNPPARYIFLVIARFTVTFMNAVSGLLSGPPGANPLGS